jgi:hypothetical protein
MDAEEELLLPHSIVFQIEFVGTQEFRETLIKAWALCTVCL